MTGLAAILWKDARRELRTKESLQAGLVLVLLFLLLFLLSFRDLSAEPTVAAAVLWVPGLYGAAALCGRGFASETDRGTLDLARLLPASLAVHGWSRTLVHAGLLALLAAVGVAASALLFHLTVTASLVATLVLATAGLAVAGTLASVIAAPARSREALLPILLVPAVAPLLQAGLEATRMALSGASVLDARVPLLLMLGYDLVLAGAAAVLFPIALEAD